MLRLHATYVCDRNLSCLLFGRLYFSVASFSRVKACSRRGVVDLVVYHVRSITHRKKKQACDHRHVCVGHGFVELLITRLVSAFEGIKRYVYGDGMRRSDINGVRSHLSLTHVIDIYTSRRSPKGRS